MKRKAVLAIVLVIIVAAGAYGAYAFYSIYLFSNGGNSCVGYLNTNCGGNHNVITYDKSAGTITVTDVSQTFGQTWYNVAVVYAPGDPNATPKGVTFQPDPTDFPGDMLNSRQSVTITNLPVTSSPAVGGYNGSIWLAYTTTSSSTSCAGSYAGVAGCEYTQIGTITLKG